MMKKEIKLIISSDDYQTLLNTINIMSEYCVLNRTCNECSLFDESGKCMRVPIIKGINAIKREAYIEKE